MLDTYIRGENQYPVLYIHHFLYGINFSFANYTAVKKNSVERRGDILYEVKRFPTDKSRVCVLLLL